MTPHKIAEVLQNIVDGTEWVEGLAEASIDSERLEALKGAIAHVEGRAPDPRMPRLPLDARDEFAAAVAGSMAKQDGGYIFRCAASAATDEGSRSQMHANAKVVARAAYAVADAMMEERTK